MASKDEFSKKLELFKPNLNKRGRMSNSTLDDLKEILDIASDYYYNTGESLITDEDFDTLLNKYQIYRKYEAGIKPRSNKKVVDTKNEVPELVGTTDKVNSIDDFIGWLNKKLDMLDINKDTDIELAVSEKYDGNSVVTFIDKDGKVFKALTRGKDGIGADITKYFEGRSISKDSELMKKYFTKDVEFLAIKHEAIMTDEDFNELNDIRNNKGLKVFTNNRSAVAGITSSDDNLEYAKYVTLVPLAFKLVGGKEVDRKDQLELLIDLDQTSNKTLKSLPISVFKVTGNVDQIKEDLGELYQHIDDMRYERTSSKKPVMNYMVDGLVIEFLNNNYRKQLGREKDRNKFDVALKFSYQTQTTKVKGIHWEISHLV